jgi:hypothetical protein
MEKIFNHKSFNYFVWTPLFCRQYRCWHRWQICNKKPTTLAKLEAKFAAGVVDTGGKFAAGVFDTSGNFATGVIDTGGASWLANIFWKKLKSHDTVPLRMKIKTVESVEYASMYCNVLGNAIGRSALYCTDIMM